MVTVVTAVALPLHSLSEQVHPNQPLLLPPLAWVGKQTPEGGPHAETGPKPKVNSRGSGTKEEKGKSLCAATGAED